MSRRGAPGNVMVLTVYQSLLIIMVAVFGLDIFSVLYTRRAVQTAADSAALGALRAVQNEFGPLLWDKADEKVKGWLEEARAIWEQAQADWESDYTAAQEQCTAEHTDEAGEVDEAAVEQCVDEWLATNPEPELARVEQQTLDGYVGDAEVVEALLGLRQDVDMDRIITAVVPPKEQVCLLHKHQGLLEVLGRDEAVKYAAENGAELTKTLVPYDGKPQVYVEVEREAPTLVISRVSGEELKAVGMAAATLLSLVEQEVGQVDCEG